jgi:hypothetical protein
MSTAIDTSAEDATEGAREGQQTINADGVELEAATPQDEDATKKAKKKRAPPLSESHLVGPHGLIRIEKDFPERLKPCVKGREREWLRQLMFLYKVRLTFMRRRCAMVQASFACRTSVTIFAKLPVSHNCLCRSGAIAYTLTCPLKTWLHALRH